MPETIGELIAKLIDIKLEVFEGRIERREHINGLIEEISKALEKPTESEEPSET